MKFSWRKRGFACAVVFRIMHFCLLCWYKREVSNLILVRVSTPMSTITNNCVAVDDSLRYRPVSALQTFIDIILIPHPSEIFIETLWHYLVRLFYIIHRKRVLLHQENILADTKKEVQAGKGYWYIFENWPTWPHEVASVGLHWSKKWRQYYSTVYLKFWARWRVGLQTTWLSESVKKQIENVATTTWVMRKYTCAMH